MHLVLRRWRKPVKVRKNKKIAIKNKLASQCRGQVKKMKEKTQSTELENGANDGVLDCQFLFVHSSCWKKLCESLVCSECNTKNVQPKFSKQKGFATLISFVCYDCDGIVSESYSSPQEEKENKKGNFIVNRKLVDGINTIGLGYAALERLCIVLDMNCMSITSFHKHLNALAREGVELENRVLENARSQVRELHLSTNIQADGEQILQVCGSYDGTWHRRGHTSLYGVGIIIDVLSGLVLDFEICSKYCAQCEIAKKKYDGDDDAFSAWYRNHVKQDCNKNYEGSSGSMEVEAAKKIWSRSVSKNKMMYTKVISDGDCKTVTSLNELAPYGDIVIEKEECINHVHKRLGTGLRNITKKNVWEEKSLEH